jgi:hypothetical protein
MADLFKEIIPSILQTKQYALLTEQDEKSYSPFMVNRALSYHRDTALLANQMNLYPSTDKKLQYDFLLNIVRASKRPYSKWYKKAKSSDLDTVKEYYGYSDSKAVEALKVLSEDQIAAMKKQLIKG